LSKESEAAENESWEKVGEVLDAEMSSVEDVRFDLAKSEKGYILNSRLKIIHCSQSFDFSNFLQNSV